MIYLIFFSKCNPANILEVCLCVRVCVQVDVQPSSVDEGQCGAQRGGAGGRRGRQLPVLGGRPGADLLRHRPHQTAAERPWGVG